MTSPPVLLTGATGFLGRALRPHLERAGLPVRCGSRSPDAAARRAPGAHWVRLDLDAPDSLSRALDGVEVAFFLVHGMSEGPGYAEREAAAARAFAGACARTGVRRIVYMGGVDPAGDPSVHLTSRIETGRLLRAGSVPAVELRAGMIAGPGSTSWQLVSDLARRLPFSATGDWLDRTSWPVFVDDVCAALVHCATTLELDRSRWLDAPGPERIGHGALVRRVMRAMGRRPPHLHLPRVPPRLARIGVRLLSEAQPMVAAELVEGLREDLDPTGPTIWRTMPGFVLTELDTMIARCLAG